MMAFNHGGVGGDLDPSMFGEAGIHAGLFEAFSRGSVRLASADPLDDPVVDARHARRRARPRPHARRRAAPGPIGTHPAVQAITARRRDRQYRPARRRSGRRRRRRLRRLAAADCAEAQHGAGGCVMGPYEVDDGRSVVDPDGRVRGIASLRVADASIMPYDCKANTCLTTIMIGEHIADRMRRASQAEQAGLTPRLTRPRRRRLSPVSAHGRPLGHDGRRRTGTARMTRTLDGSQPGSRVHAGGTRRSRPWACSLVRARRTAGGQRSDL